jgi:hypothetical protein
MRRLAQLTSIHRDERGLSVAELIISSSIMAVVTAVLVSTLGAVQRVVSHTDSRGVNNDQARLAMIQLDREIRSGNVLYDPATETPAGFVLRIYTQSNANIRTPSPGYVCRLWQIDSEGRLQTRHWPPDQPDAATNWVTVATGIVNRIVSPQVTAFSRSDPTSASGGRVVNVTLLVNNNYDKRPNETVRIQTSITGRNTSYGFPVDVCDDTPA